MVPVIVGIHHLQKKFHFRTTWQINQSKTLLYQGFPGSSAGKESAWNAGDPSSIPGLGRSAREEIGYPFQYSWASLVGQLVKNPPPMRETWVQSLGWEDPLEEGMATHSSIVAWRIPMDRGAWWAPARGIAELDMPKQLSTQHIYLPKNSKNIGNLNNIINKHI